MRQPRSGYLTKNPELTRTPIRCILYPSIVYHTSGGSSNAPLRIRLSHLWAILREIGAWWPQGTRCSDALPHLWPGQLPQRGHSGGCGRSQWLGIAGLVGCVLRSQSCHTYPPEGSGNTVTARPGSDLSTPRAPRTPMRVKAIQSISSSAWLPTR